MNKRIEEELNAQINREFHSAYIYLSMCAYFDSQNLKGFANFMKVQYQEEVSHAMKMFEYVNEVGGKVLLQPIAEVKTEWKSVIEAFEDTYAHEKYITASINNLLSITHEEKDYATINFLQWYVSEQVEEEATVSGILGQLKMIEGKGAGLFMMDNEFQTRTFVDSTNA